MRGAMLFVAGVIAGLGAQAVVGQPRGRDIVSLNHVAIGVDDFEATTRFYRDVMGFPEAFAFTEADGKPYLSYFQINRSTFIEVMPAGGERPRGFIHYGLEVTNLDALVKRLRAQGVQVRDPSVSPRTRTRIAVATMKEGTTVELLEMGPDSMHRKVMDAWK